jgi:hypothetical protein
MRKLIILSALLLFNCTSRKIVEKPINHSQFVEEDTTSEFKIKKSNLDNSLKVYNDTSQFIANKVGRDAKSAQIEIQKKMPDLQYEYNKELANNSKLSGSIAFEIKIASDGSVVSCELVRDKTGDELLVKRLQLAILNWKFTKVNNSTDTLTLRYTFAFSL